MPPSPLSLKLNPAANISIGTRDQSPTFLVEAPIRGSSYSSVRVDTENLPDAHAFLCAALIDGCERAQINQQAATELRRIGLFTDADATPQPVSYEFPQYRPDQAGLLVSRAEIESMSVNSTARRLELPAEWSGLPLGFVAHHHGSIWAPVRLNRMPNSSSVTKHAEHYRAAVELDSEATRTLFARDAFVVLDNLLPAQHVTELGRYFQRVAEEGFLRRVDEQGTQRFVAHNHPVAKFWHEQLNERVSALAGQPTKPSYCFASLYVGGQLPWHTDRPPCEYTIALLLDCTPLNADGRSPWALKLKGRDGTIRSIHQKVGDALIFRGRELKHSREVLSEGHRSASLLFHFVNADYDGVME